MSFPIDVVAGILVLLPAKSLMRFKCVDRSWNDLFTTPTFINNNMKKKKKNDRLLLSWEYRPITFRQILTEDEEFLECPPFPSLPLGKERLSLDISGCNSYKGVLFCVEKYYEKYCVEKQDFRQHERLILWNPSIRDFKVISSPPSASLVKAFLYRGFGGTDSSNNDFSVIYLYLNNPEEEEEVVVDFPPFLISSKDLPPYSAELYNSSTDSWTVLDINDHVLPVQPLFNAYHLTNRSGTDSIHVNGVCYWIYRDDEDYDYFHGAILCFDFRNNQFRKLELPPHTYVPNNALTEIHDSLAYLVHFLYSADIWVYEPGASYWTKKYVFENLHCSFHFSHLWRDGPEFLSCAYEYLISTNSDGHIVSHFKQACFKCYGPFHFEIWKYVESIVPLSFS